MKDQLAPVCFMMSWRMMFSRAVIEPREVLREFGVSVPEDREVRVWDSTSEVRYLVIPERPQGTEGWSEEKLAQMLSRDTLVGVTVPRVRNDPNGSPAA